MLLASPVKPDGSGMRSNKCGRHKLYGFSADGELPVQFREQNGLSDQPIQVMPNDMTQLNDHRTHGTDRAVSAIVSVMTRLANSPAGPETESASDLATLLKAVKAKNRDARF